MKLIKICLILAMASSINVLAKRVNDHELNKEMLKSIQEQNSTKLPQKPINIEGEQRAASKTNFMSHGRAPASIIMEKGGDRTNGLSKW